MSAVVVVDYDPRWPADFARLRDRVAQAVGSAALAIEHVGSTSVPGLAAKPIIDIDVIVADVTQSRVAIERLATLGYVHRGDLGIAGREAFTKPAGEVAHNLYVCLDGCLSLRNHLALRDYLSAYPEARDQYAALKKNLARQFNDSIDDYIEGKTAFITSILERSGLAKEGLDRIMLANKAQR